MILTEIDLKILRIFWKLNREELKSPWKIMKKIYPNGGNDENQKIMYHLKKMNNYGLVTVNNTKISNDLTLRIYNLDSKKVKLKKYKFPDNVMGECICLKTDEKWQMIQI